MYILNNLNEEEQEYYYLFKREELSEGQILSSLRNKEERIECALKVIEGYCELNNRVNIPNFLKNTRYITEFILENQRKNYFPNFPTRLACIFAVASEETAELIRQNYNWKTPLVRLKPVANSKIVKCDMVWLEYIDSLILAGHAQTTIEAVCKFYWEGMALNTAPGITEAPLPQYEYLIDGIAIIVK